jgi:hypothetical protein
MFLQLQPIFPSNSLSQLPNAHPHCRRRSRRSVQVACSLLPPPPPTLPSPSPSSHLAPYRITRIAESHYLQSLIASNDLLFPTIVITGASHASFLSGYPPLLVRSRDLRPETSEADVHEATASNFAAFVLQIISRASAHLQPLADTVTSSAEFFAPIQSA